MNLEFKNFPVYKIPPVTQKELQVYNSIIIVLRKADYVENEDLLSKILGAIKLDIPHQVSFVQLEEGEFYNTGILPKSTQHLLAFGFKPSDLGFNTAFKGYRFYQTETFSILFSHTLAKLSSEQAKKKQLWEALKSEFISNE